MSSIDPTQPPAVFPAPGWYPDPNTGTGSRWWTGREWSIYNAQPPTVILTPQKKKVRHGLHLFLSIITAGLWLPVWLILAISA